MNIFSKVDEIPIESFDMSDPFLYQEGVALYYFERLRWDCPVHYCESSNYGAFWSITKHKDILSVDKNHHLFSADSSQRGHLLGYEMWFNSDPDLQFPMMIAMDPPKHNVQRRAVSAAVGSENLERMTIAIRNNVIEILDSLSEGETFNWVDLVSIELTTLMIKK